MHVAVIIRNTVDCLVPLPTNAYGEKPLREGLINIINPSDWSAFEQAVVLKRQGMVRQISVLYLGGLEGEETLRWCLASGADVAQRLWDPALEAADQLGKGKTMAAALERLNVELLLCGDGCLDQLNSLMPGIAAAVLGFSYVTEVEKVEKLGAGQAIVIRRREKGKREKLLVQLPALIAITDKGHESSERADLADTLEAFTQEIPCWDLEDLGLVADTVGGRVSKVINLQIQPAKPHYTRPLIPNSEISAEQRLREILSGGIVRKQGEVVAGEPEKLVERIIEFLRQEPVMRL
ncbi:MAG: hypothetical protein APF81_21480 [Desulfosporosinus sp. BRH_c37]|nr:MAG: hypothetical protein APF81_21480 [Desulfosporosinus sp. BRH_c37]